MEEPQWFAMRSLFNTELKTKALLDASGIENFLPLHHQKVTVKGRKQVHLRPLVSNLIFVRARLSALVPFTQANSRFQHIYKRGGRQNEALTVPDRQMEEFIRAVRASDNPLFFNIGELNLKAGARVRIVSGALEGMTGRFMKVKGARNSRFVIELPTLLSAAVEMDPSQIEFID